MNNWILPEKDLRMDIFWNETEHTVRLTHIPTGSHISITDNWGRNLDTIRAAVFIKLSDLESVKRYYDEQLES